MVTLIVGGSLGTWLALSPEFSGRSGVAIGALVLMAALALIWLFGLYLPTRACEYEIAESEIRFFRSGARAETIAFSSINRVRRLGRSLVLFRAEGRSVYLYPGDASAQIQKGIEGVRSRQQDRDDQSPKLRR